jgi:hypothetical protein
MVEKTFEGLSPDCQKQIWPHGSDSWWLGHLPADGNLLS